MIKHKIEVFINTHPRFKKFFNILNKFWGDDVFGLSAELTFYLTASFFPFVILLLALISITPLSAEDTLFKLLAALPREVYEVVIYVLTGVNRSTGIIITSSVIALWSVSCAASTINKALNRMYKTVESRNFIVIRSIGFLFAILLAVTIVLTFLLIVFGNLIGMAIMRFLPSFYVVWHALRLIITYLIVITAFATIYKILPNEHLSYKNVIWGSLFTTFLWGCASLLFSFYVDNFSKYHIIYGGLAGILVLMTWLYMSSFIFMTGGEINAIIHLNKK